MGSAGAADSTAKDVCSTCDDGCTDEDEKNLRDALTALGVVLAYCCGCGWLSCVFGITASAMGCGTAFPCCGPLKDKQNKGVLGQAPVGGMVVGQAVGQQPPAVMGNAVAADPKVVVVAQPAPTVVVAQAVTA